MGKFKGCGKLGRIVPRDGSVSAYHYSLMLSPVVSVWDCIVQQKKIEEQQWLNEEGAAIAEAIALRVLLGEDSDDSCKIVLKKDEEDSTIWIVVAILASLWEDGGQHFLVMAVQSVPLADQGLFLILMDPDANGTTWGTVAGHYHLEFFEEISMLHILKRAVKVQLKSLPVLLRHRLFHYLKLQKMPMQTRLPSMEC
ncbi:hypothetical protein HHK36_001671 [Tetracentron sinense]|uniref:Uncharacterized protein n=1 Tax=Tetracentron sinense TaxID=13715 RepID=A0A834ZU38_TETSI|nr:hypothetical protein HHK36_001671 [Tetracentron sinense]